MSLFLVAVAGASAFAQGTGSVSGAVTSASTRNALQGAVVSIPALNRSEFTDNAGAFTISGLPAGSHELVISYTGFEDTRRSVTVRGGEIARLDTELKSANAVMMEAFTVATVKEGQALAITEQRNALNVKNVTAFDEWGILPTQNVGELVSRMPGITFTTDEDNLINNVSIGGLPASYTRLNIDGMSSTGVGGDGRQATLHSFSASQYEAVEIIAGQTPDRRADSLGGQLNLKTASPLNMRDKRRTTYTVSGRFFPSSSERTHAVGERGMRPDFSVSHQEVFSVGNGDRNLGVMVNASYQEVLNQHDWDILLYEATTNPTAQFRDYTRKSGLNDRFLTAFGARMDYKWSNATRVSLRFLYNGGSEPYFNYTDVNPWASANLTVFNPAAPVATASVMPGYTNSRIEFRPTTTVVNGNTVGAAQMRLFPQKYSFTSKNPTGTLVFEHNWGRLKVDHAYRWSNTHWNSGAGTSREGGTVAMRTRDAIGFVLDYSNPRGKVFTQTAGPSVTDPASYAAFTTAAATATQPVAPTSTVLTKRDTITDTNEVAANLNASYLLPMEHAITVKAGLDTVNRRVNNRQVYPRRWYATVGTVLPVTGLMPVTEFERANGGPRLPIVDPAAISTTLGNSAMWTEDVNFTATSQYTNRRILEEGVDAAYVQASTRFGPLTLLGGVRREWVTTDTFTYFRARTTAIAAEPDHFKRAALDYQRLSKDGDYAKSFPSIHLAYDITSNLKARASWSTSYGRPTLAQLIVAPSASDANRTVSLGNPDLKPQNGKNVDLKLEYYYSGTGMISVRGYRKSITDYIGASGRSGELVGAGPDNGFEGLYEGYEIIQTRNLGSATYKGLEFDFRQRLTFLPGALRGLTVRANYTYLRAEGNFGGTVGFSTNSIAGFIPRAYNIGLLYAYGKWGASYDVNYTGSWPVVNATPGAAGNRFRESWTVMNAGIRYDVFRNSTLFANVSNLAQEGRQEYIFDSTRPRHMYVIPLAVKFGLTGRF
ncbi:MAG: TonB-dependent receptor [Opitutaceae bacterium]|nr:TonB-dependent receptor [Opitutaceae bacterium]